MNDLTALLRVKLIKKRRLNRHSPKENLNGLTLHPAGQAKQHLNWRHLEARGTYRMTLATGLLCSRPKPDSPLVRWSDQSYQAI
jgi:hypothetical protein